MKGFRLADGLGRYLPEAGISRKVVVVASGAAGGQVVAVLATPLLTRLYSPSDFGVLGLYLSVVGITSVVSTLCYEKAIPIAPTGEDARSLLVLSLVAVLCVSLLVVLAGLLLPRTLARFPTIDRVRPYFWVLLVGLIGLGFHQALSMWGIRQGAYSVLARAKFAQGAGATILQVGLGLLKGGPLTLLSGDALGRLLGSGSLLVLGQVYRDLGSAVCQWRHHLLTAWKYRRFPGFGLGSSLINAAGGPGIIFIVAMLFDPWQTGLFVFADRMINIPIALIGRAASQVFIGEISQVIKGRPEAFQSHYRLALGKLNVFGVILAIALLVLSPLLVAPIFGERWREAGLLMAILAPAAWVQFVAYPVSECPVLLGRLDLQLAWNAGRLVLVYLALWIPRRWGAGLLSVTAFYSAAVTISYVALLFMIAQAKPSPLDRTEACP